MKRIYYFLGIILLLNSCSKIDIVENKRLYIKGEIQNTSGEGIVDIPITVQTYAWTHFLRPEYLLNIFEDFSDASGDFSFTTVDVENELLLVTINADNYNTSYNSSYQSITFLDNRPERYETLLNLETLVLKEITSFEIVFINSSGTTEALMYNITYHNPQPFIPILDWTSMTEVTDAEENTRYLALTGSISSEGTNSILDFSSLIETDAIVKYYVGNELFEIAIPITAQDTPYEIHY